MAELTDRVDHLVWAAPELDAGVEELERLLGVRPEVGGRHPGYGTRNALLSLGPSVYLEVIGPDPDLPVDGPRVFGIDTLTRGRLVTWAAREADVAGRVAAARARDVALGDALPGERRRPDGTVLTWVLSDPHAVVAEGLVPFLIDWGETRHPATTSPPAGVLLGLRAEHPDPGTVQATLRVLDLALPVAQGPVAALVATIRTPAGEVELR